MYDCISSWKDYWVLRIRRWRYFIQQCSNFEDTLTPLPRIGSSLTKELDFLTARLFFLFEHLWMLVSVNISRPFWQQYIYFWGTFSRFCVLRTSSEKSFTYDRYTKHLIFQIRKDSVLSVQNPELQLKLFLKLAVKLHDESTSCNF